jgi:WD40 repeat protein
MVDEKGHAAVFDVADLSESAAPTDSLIDTLPDADLVPDRVAHVPPARVVISVPGISVALSADGSKVATTTKVDLPRYRWQQEVTIWSGTTGQPVTTLPDHDDVFAYSPDGSRLACLRSHPSASDPIVIDLLNADDPTELMGSIEPGFWMHFVRFSPDGKHLAIRGKENGPANYLLAVFDVERGERQMTTAIEYQPRFLDFARDGSLMVAAEDKTVRLWNARSWEELDALKQSHPVSGFSISPDGRWLVVLVDEGEPGPYEGDGPPRVASNRLRLWDLQSRQVVDTVLDEATDLASAQFALDGGTLLLKRGDWHSARWEFWRFEESDFSLVAKMPSETIGRIDFSHDGSTMMGVGGVSTVVRSSIRLWECGRAEPVQACFSRK